MSPQLTLSISINGTEYRSVVDIDSKDVLIEGPGRIAKMLDAGVKAEVLWEAVVRSALNGLLLSIDRASEKGEKVA